MANEPIYAADVMQRADELMTSAPGQVSVRRINDIREVRVLRAATEQLSADEAQQLRSFRLDLMERLDGCRAAVAPPEPEPKKGLLAALLSPLGAIVKGVSKDVRAQGEFDQMTSHLDGAARLPAPPELLDAAEAWIIAELASDRIDDDLSVLRAPWESAEIE